LILSNYLYLICNNYKLIIKGSKNILIMENVMLKKVKKTPRQIRKEKKIKERYIELYNQGLRSAVIMDTLDEEFNLSPSRIYQILDGVKEFKEKVAEEMAKD